MPKVDLSHDEWPDQRAEKPAKPDGDRHPGRTQGELAIGAIKRFCVFFLVGIPMLILGPIGGLVFVCATAIAGVGVLRGLVSLGQSICSDGEKQPGFVLRVFVATVLNGFLALCGMIFAIASTSVFSRGRQLRRFGRLMLPDVTPGAEWTGVPMDTTVDPDAREGLAAQWRENGRTEHASVGAFARLTLDLLALGAPPTLVAAANRDSLDEIRHTELCFSVARSLDGRDESPGPFPAARSARTLVPGRALALSALAVDSLVDGALHEGISARVIARLVKHCDEPRIREVLRELAADEGRHAAHGWDVVEWCLAVGGYPVAAVLRGAALALPKTMHGDLPAEAEDGAWQRYGIHGRALETDEYAKARAEVVGRVQRLTSAQLIPRA